MLVYVLSGSLLVAAAALWRWRLRDQRRDRAAIQRLAATQPVRPERFDPGMVADLPEPARRYFQYTIQPGTPLHTVATITMTGRFGLGTSANPTYLDMAATQTLALPAGFVWTMKAKSGLMRVSGSDSDRWTRFWLMGLLPVARTEDDADHRRAAFGRCAAEAVFWTPAAVLPGEGIQWAYGDRDRARLTVRHDGLAQSVDLTVAPDGQPVQVCMERWSNANPDKVYRLQPFGGTLTAFRVFSGFRLPTHVEAGNFFGTASYFPFFVADVATIDFSRG